MDRLLILARRLALFGVWAGGGVLFAAAFVVGFEVLIRKLFDRSLGGADDIAGFALAISTAWALPLALLDRAHIRIDSLYSHLPKRLCAILDVVGVGLFAVFAGFILVYGFGVFMTSYRLHSTSLSALSIPLAIPQLIWILGILLFFLTAFLLLVRGLTFIVHGDIDQVRLLLSSRTLEEETEEELRDLERRSGSA